MGRAAVFLRFAGCNLWSGREQDRATATCRFCDTDFVGGRRYELDALTEAAAALWPDGVNHPFIVLTGGEPALQIDAELVHALKRRKFEIAIETNGTIEIASLGLDWTCVSPKAGTELRVRTADEIKLVFPQPDLMPGDLPPTQALHHWLSPDGRASSRRKYSGSDRILHGAPEMALGNPGAQVMEDQMTERDHHRLRDCTKDVPAAHGEGCCPAVTIRETVRPSSA